MQLSARRAACGSMAAATAAAIALVASALVLGSPAVASPVTSGHGPKHHHGHGGQLTATVILSGASLSHTFIPAAGGGPTVEPLTKPDDITSLGRHIFVAFQNGVGAQGEASSDGNTASTIVEMSRDGQPINQWDVIGKCDGLTAAFGELIATVNEDGNSSIYLIDPSAASASAVQHFTYSEALPHNGGTDSIAVVHGTVILSASAPGTTGGPAAPDASYPAAYAVTFDQSKGIADLTSLFSDEATATVANAGSSQGTAVTLALTDPDSSIRVPARAPRFGHDYMLDSQGDLEQIYSPDPTAAVPRLEVLQLSQSVDDTAFPSGHDPTLFATDSTNDTVDTVTGDFSPDQAIVAVTPCGANSAPSSCPAPPEFPANYLGALDLFTGSITPLQVSGADLVPQGGLLFVGPSSDSHRSARTTS